MITKNVMVTLAGRPNVGKSTLTNALVGEKISIVSNKPQTTRNRIFAILNQDDTQIILTDTPGFHRAKNRLGDYMVKCVEESVADVDVIALVVEPIANVGVQEEQLIAKIKATRAPSVLVINKIDTVEKPELLEVIAAYSAKHEFDAIIPVSARKKQGLNELIEEFKKHAIEGPQLFPDDMVTDQPERQVCAEFIREKLLLCLQHEIPHGTAIEITRFAQRESDDVIEVEATIYCERDSHKGIIIGKKGAMLKKIGEMARKDMETFMGAKVYLQTWVKVKENWRDSNNLLRNFGYSE